MKRARKSKSNPLHTVDMLHFRLCHVCYFLNEAEKEVSECTKCHNTFVPEGQWEEDVSVYADGAFEEHIVEEESDEMEGMSWARRKSLGLQGLTAVF